MNGLVMGINFRAINRIRKQGGEEDETIIR